MQPSYSAGVHPERLYEMPIRRITRGQKGVIIMPQKFILEITLGNEGVQTTQQLAAALEYAAKQISCRQNAYLHIIANGFQPYIRDSNGNVVGHYEVI